jgi:16S rRNA (uracil1498-N3)-methyltransferase
VVVGDADQVAVRLLLAPAALVPGERTLDGDEHHYLMRVRRARIGDAVEVFDGAGRRAQAELVAIGEATTTVRIGEVVAVMAATPRITALLPLIKGERMDVALEKLVEVGADAIVVWPATRSVVKLDGERRATRAPKLQAAALAAARQCGRADVPTVSLAASLEAALAALPPSHRLVLDPGAEAGLALPAPCPAEVAIASGPEGGLAPDELDRLIAAGFTPVGLGPRILRAETAPVVMVALVRAATGS